VSFRRRQLSGGAIGQTARCRVKEICSERKVSIRSKGDEQAAWLSILKKTPWGWIRSAFRKKEVAGGPCSAQASAAWLQSPDRKKTREATICGMRRTPQEPTRDPKNGTIVSKGRKPGRYRGKHRSRWRRESPRGDRRHRHIKSSAVPSRRTKKEEAKITLAWVEKGARARGGSGVVGGGVPQEINSRSQSKANEKINTPAAEAITNAERCLHGTAKRLGPSKVKEPLPPRTNGKPTRCSTPRYPGVEDSTR